MTMLKTTITRVTLVYPDYLQGIEIYTDSSKLQLGAVITQSNRPLVFFSRKLSPMQQKYSVTEQKLLAIVETLEEFKGMLWDNNSWSTSITRISCRMLLALPLIEYTAGDYS